MSPDIPFKSAAIEITYSVFEGICERCHQTLIIINIEIVSALRNLAVRLASRARKYAIGKGKINIIQAFLTGLCSSQCYQIGVRLNIACGGKTEDYVAGFFCFEDIDEIFDRPAGKIDDIVVIRILSVRLPDSEGERV